MKPAPRRNSIFAATPRRDAAWLLLVLWSVTFLAVPLLHMIGHRADHVHLAGGGVLELEQALHHHDDGTVHAHEGKPADPEPTPEPLPVHGAESPEHLSAALVSTWSLTTVQVSTVLMQRLQPLERHRPAAPWVWRGRGARGPPAWVG